MVCVPDFFLMCARFLYWIQIVRVYIYMLDFEFAFILRYEVSSGSYVYILGLSFVYWFLTFLSKYTTMLLQIGDVVEWYQVCFINIWYISRRWHNDLWNVVDRICCLGCLNSLWPSDTIRYRRNGSSVLQAMACRIHGAIIWTNAGIYSIGPQEQLLVICE